MRISSARNIPHRWAVVAIVLLLALLVPLLPWPMEGRAQAELGLSINAVVETARTRMTGAAVTWPAPTFDMAK